MFDASFAHPLAIVAALGALAVATPAFAKELKPVTIVMPVHAVADATKRICMPRTTLPGREDKTLPKTICQTRDAWAAQKVMIVAK